jgi:hypothetical protein
MSHLVVLGLESPAKAEEVFDEEELVKALQA